MTIEKLSPSELLGLDRFEVDEEEPHIIVDKNACGACAAKPCLYICSAVCYKLNDQGLVQFDYAGCLECGTCRIACRTFGNRGVTSWEYPRGTFGVNFRYG